VSTMLKAALLVLKEMGRLGAMEIVIGLRGHVLKALKRKPVPPVMFSDIKGRYGLTALAHSMEREY